MSDKSLDCVPCVEINAQNLTLWWNAIIEATNGCHFLALDLELSGLGNRHTLSAKNIDERYEGLSSAAKSRSVLSIGLSFFQFCANNSKPDNIVSNETKHKSNECLNQLVTESVEDVNRFAALDSDLMVGPESECHLNDTQNQCNISAKVFNMLCLCEDEYICEPETLRFLAGHGFDFNSQCLQGLTYHRGNDMDCEDYSKPNLRNLISHIIRQKVPIVLHNGFIDLIFLYQNFYCELPNDLQTFIADLVELFPAGVFDTKYIADFQERLKRSYLEYLFYEKQRFNIERSMKGQVCVEFTFPSMANNSHDIQFNDLSTNLFTESELLVDICYDYANHGWCKLSHTCNRSHNIDHILDKKKNRSKRMKKMYRKMQRNSEEHNNDKTSGGDNSLVDSKTTIRAKGGVHRAGYDAFMTGYCLAFYIAINAKTMPDPSRPLTAKALGVSQIVNNIYLTGKDQSLRINASSFAKTSTDHKNKILRLRSDNS